LVGKSCLPWADRCPCRDDAVFEAVPFAKYTGKKEIRAYFEEAIALNATVEHEILKVEDDTV
jgi:hypothetical protein